MGIRWSKPAQALVRNAIDLVRAQNVEAVILACRELPLLLGVEAEEAGDLINPTQPLAWPRSSGRWTEPAQLLIS
jgi:aspartate/glutamate racemase